MKNTLPQCNVQALELLSKLNINPKNSNDLDLIINKKRTIQRDIFNKIFLNKNKEKN